MLYHTVGLLAEAGPDSLLLDVCCGTGTIGLTLAKQVWVVLTHDLQPSTVCVCVGGGCEGGGRLPAWGVSVEGRWMHSSLACW